MVIVCVCVTVIQCVWGGSEYWIIYRGPGFLAFVPPPPTDSKLYQRHTERPRKRDNLLTGGEGVKRVGEEPNHTPQGSLVLHKIVVRERISIMFLAY